MISGIVLQGNLFERCGAVQFGAVQIHGGKENVVDGNVFIVSEEPVPPGLLSDGNPRDPKLGRILFEPIPVAEMGPYPHTYRAASAPVQ